MSRNADLRRIADQLGLTVTEPYRVGLGWDLDRLRLHLRIGKGRAAPRRNWRGVRWTLKLMGGSARRRSWWGLWQCEGTISRHARRGLTARAAERRMLRDEINAAMLDQGADRG